MEHLKTKGKMFVDFNHDKNTVQGDTLESSDSRCNVKLERFIFI